MGGRNHGPSQSGASYELLLKRRCTTGARRSGCRLVRRRRKRATAAALAVRRKPDTRRHLAMPAAFPDEIEVLNHSFWRPHLVAAIELVSPSSKDRPETQWAFAAKCATYTPLRHWRDRRRRGHQPRCNLHDEMIDLMCLDRTLRFPGNGSIISSLINRGANRYGDHIDASPLATRLADSAGSAFLALRNGPIIRLIESTYTTTAKTCCDTPDESPDRRRHRRPDGLSLRRHVYSLSPRNRTRPRAARFSDETIDDRLEVHLRTRRFLLLDSTSRSISGLLYVLAMSGLGRRWADRCSPGPRLSSSLQRFAWGSAISSLP